MWDPRRGVVWWVDPPARAIHYLELRAGTERIFTVRLPVGSLALSQDAGLVIAVEGGFARCSDQGEDFEWIARTAVGDRMNDGTCDPRGRFVAGTLVDEIRAPGTAVLYSLERGRVSVLLDGVTISNGLGWSPAGDVMYYIDTPRERVEAFDYDSMTGSISRRRTLVDLHGIPGRPDGLAVDADGGVWVAMARGGAVQRFTAAGEPDLVLPVPVAMVTSVAFGGDKLSDLYITTSTIRQTDIDLAAQPLAGHVLRVRSVGYEGAEPTRYQP